jgi:hypothetical protein
MLPLMVIFNFLEIFQNFSGDFYMLDSARSDVCAVRREKSDATPAGHRPVARFQNGQAIGAAHMRAGRVILGAEAGNSGMLICKWQAHCY